MKRKLKEAENIIQGSSQHLASLTRASPDKVRLVRAENIEKENRIDFWIGIGTATWSVAIFATIIGFIASDFLNKDMLIGLAIVKPIYFTCMMLGAMKTIQISLSVVLGAILGPAFYFFSPEWCILFGGFIAGTVAFLIGERNGQ